MSPLNDSASAGSMAYTKFLSFQGFGGTGALDVQILSGSSQRERLAPDVGTGPSQHDPAREGTCHSMFCPTIQQCRRPGEFGSRFGMSNSKGFSVSPLGIVLYFCLYKTQEDIKHIICIKVLRGV